MQTDPADRPSRFPLAFEALIWLSYVGLYKYSVYLSGVKIPAERSNFPYPHLALFAVLATLYVVPYYRWLVPRLLRQRRYWWLLGTTLVYFWYAEKWNFQLTRLLFLKLAKLGWGNLATLPTWSNIELKLTDLIAFSCVAFVAYAFEQETRRRRIERDHLALQMDQLKAQLQPHFLFNTLNSIYGLSLAGSPETPRFILLLSELMRYVLYDSGKDDIALVEEVAFLENYFEMEQRKYAGARIRFAAGGPGLGALRVPPLLLLPLVENSFKHGRHHFADGASVEATLMAGPDTLHFVIENDVLPPAPPAAPGAPRRGGIGLVNIRQRLQLYYPGAHELLLSEHNGRYRAELTLRLPPL
ncbi:sensor histidine kinase [Hymenobacter nivis]|uniref:Histidine kinase n=1 Tax=Hymenobacter nivis TaxID=1850093 RepID=A0A502GLL5_9BACT|nr:sensor histidine kinase [Hymenobacter nivis]TPG62412.1 histidine kinase [Hymenobacter nivis]